MFDNMTEDMKKTMHELELLDAKDRADGTPRLKRLRQIPAETGKFLAILASLSPQGDMLEIGTSAGYSTLWLSLAAKAAQRNIKTFELLPEKIVLAKETFARCSIGDYVELVEGDALENLLNVEKASFCFLDCEKEIYMDAWNLVAGRIVPGGIIVADNVISHREALFSMIDHVMSDRRFDSVIVPIGKGELVSYRKISA